MTGDWGGGVEVSVGVSTSRSRLGAKWIGEGEGVGEERNDLLWLMASAAAAACRRSCSSRSAMSTCSY